MRFGDRVLYPADIVAVNEEHDLAMIRVPTAEATPLAIGSGGSVPFGEQVAVITYRDSHWTVEVGTVTGYRSGGPGRREGIPGIAISIQPFRGMSGAPVLDRESRVIGLVQSADIERTTAYLVPGDLVQQVFAEFIPEATDN